MYWEILWSTILAEFRINLHGFLWFDPYVQSTKQKPASPHLQFTTMIFHRVFSANTIMLHNLQWQGYGYCLFGQNCFNFQINKPCKGCISERRQEDTKEYHDWSIMLRCRGKTEQIICKFSDVKHTVSSYTDEVLNATGFFFSNVFSSFQTVNVVGDRRLCPPI